MLGDSGNSDVAVCINYRWGGELGRRHGRPAVTYLIVCMFRLHFTVMCTNVHICGTVGFPGPGIQIQRIRKLDLIEFLLSSTPF